MTAVRLKLIPSPKKTVAGILSGILSKVEELLAHEAEQRAAAEAKALQASVLLGESNEATAEADRAQSVAEKIQALVS